jgi:hypothetical protein
MKFLIAALFLASITQTTLAQSRNQTLREIRDLAIQIENETFNTRGDQRTLNQVKSYLQRALGELQNGGGNPTFEQCRNYVFPELDRVMSSRDALDETLRLCRTVEAYEEMVFLHTELDSVMSTRDSIAQAAAYADSSLYQKIDVLRYAFEKYDRTLSTRDAAARSVRAVGPIQVRRGPGGTLSCFQKTFPVYDRSMSTADAMDRTAQACR